jgi:mersacidin/lichenicidin family type 2 lantibiotic
MHNEAGTSHIDKASNSKTKENIETMSKELIIRAWRDEEYLLSLSEAERALLPEHPAGLIELTDEELGPVAGGRPGTYTTLTCCTCNPGGSGSYTCGL